MNNCDYSIFDYWGCCNSIDLSHYATDSDIDKLWDALEDISISGYDDTEIWDALNEHVDNDNIHVTDAEKERWNNISALTAQIEALQGAIVGLADRVSTLEGIMAQKADSSAITEIWDALSECCSGTPVPPEPPTPTGTTKKFVITVSGGSNIEADCDSDTYLDSTQTKQDSSTFMRYLTAEIGDCITEIGDGVFQGCFNMTSITVPSGVTDIHNYAFSTTHVEAPVTHLDVFIYATVPPTLHDDGEPQFGYFPEDCTIYVPSGSLTAYKTAWNMYSGIIQSM